jgi:protein involved in polysaccharide export with SLBB domain
MFKINFLSFTFLLAFNFAAIGQITPFGIQSPSLMRPSNLSNYTPTQSNVSRRTQIISNREKSYNDSIIRNRSSINTDSDTAIVSLRRKIFGFNIFSNKIGAFEPNLKIATPKSYILGPDDELIIDINGYSEDHYNLTVNADGYIKINRIGNVYVAGLTIEEAKQRIISKLSQIFIGLKREGSGPSKTNLYASLSLGNIRTISVLVQGEVMFPGTYSVSSLSRVMNVLYLAGGPNEKGTFREIQVIRNKKVFAKVDLYDFLTSGIQKNDITLQDQDVVKVGVYKKRIEVRGKVKRPAIFELKENENLKTVLDEFSGGFSEDAFKDLVKITRYTNRDRKLIDLSADFFTSFFPVSGDLIQIESIDENRFDNKVTIIGEVFRPGDFSLDSNPTLLKLIERSGGVRENAFLDRIVIQRINADLSLSNLSVNYKDIVSGKSPDVKLAREDQINVFSILDLRENYTVTIHGEINLKSIKKASDNSYETLKQDNNTSKLGSNQGNTGKSNSYNNNNQNSDISNLKDENGEKIISSEITDEIKSNDVGNSLINRQVKLTLPYVDKMTVEDLILKAGGLRESAATGYVEIVRRKKNIGLDNPDLINSKIAEIIKFGISNNLQLDNTASKFQLAPFDEVFIRTSPNYELQQFITVQGQVVFPGVYGLEKKDERLSEIIKRVGGLNPQAYPQGARLIRKNQITDSEKSRKLEQLNDIQDSFTGAVIQNKEQLIKELETIGINLNKALENPGGEEDLFVLEGDILVIPKEPQTVKVTGEVLYPNSVKFISGNTFKDFINEAGGFTTTSARKKSYVIYSNGSVKSAKSFLFINHYPNIERGSEIIVPKEVKTSSSGQQIASIVGIFTGTLTSLIGIITLIKATSN